MAMVVSFRNDLGGADAVLSIVVDAPIAAFLLLKQHDTHGVAVIER